MNSIDIYNSQDILDSSFRMIIMIYTLSLAILNFSKKTPAVIVLCSSTILLSLTYGYYLTSLAYKQLKDKVERRFTIIYYFVQMTVLLVLFFALGYTYFA